MDPNENPGKVSARRLMRHVRRGNLAPLWSIDEPSAETVRVYRGALLAPRDSGWAGVSGARARGLPTERRSLRGGGASGPQLEEQGGGGERGRGEEGLCSPREASRGGRGALRPRWVPGQARPRSPLPRACVLVSRRHGSAFGLESGPPAFAARTSARAYLSRRAPRRSRLPPVVWLAALRRARPRWGAGLVTGEAGGGRDWDGWPRGGERGGCGEASSRGRRGVGWRGGRGRGR